MKNEKKKFIVLRKLDWEWVLIALVFIFWSGVSVYFALKAQILINSLTDSTDFSLFPIILLSGVVFYLVLVMLWDKDFREKEVEILVKEKTR